MVETPPGQRAGRKSLGDRLAPGIFALSCLLIAFGYGVATMKYEIFPHGLLARAQLGWDAWRKVERNDEPPHFIRYLDQGESQQRITQTAPVGATYSDVILMMGGFYYRTDICPKVGCMAWIMDRQGKVLHTWSADPEALFKEADFTGFDGYPGARNVFVQGVDMDRDGNLVVVFQGRNVFPYQLGLAKFSPEGKLLWKRMEHSHHWPTVGPDGRIYAPMARIEKPSDTILGLPRKASCRQGAVYQEGVRVTAPDGSTLHEFWMEDVVRQSDRRVLGYIVRDDCDPYHVNGIDLVNANGAAQLVSIGVADAKAGDLIVSLRSASAVVVMDSETGRIKHIVFGPMVEQHSPATLPDGGFLVFDNIGASAAPHFTSRILKAEFAPERYEQIFPRPGSKDVLYAHEQGAVNVSKDGSRALVAETLGGRVLEINLETGEQLWAYREVDDINGYLAAGGAERKDDLALLQTPGAEYVSLEDFTRMFGAGNAAAASPRVAGASDAP